MTSADVHSQFSIQINSYFSEISQAAPGVKLVNGQNQSHEIRMSVPRMVPVVTNWLLVNETLLDRIS